MKNYKSLEQAKKDAIESIEDGAMFVGDMTKDVARQLEDFIELLGSYKAKIKCDTDFCGNSDPSIFCVYINEIEQ